MTWEAWATVAVVAFIFYLLASNKAAPDISLGAGLLMTLGLLSSKLPTARDAAAAFGNAPTPDCQPHRIVTFG